MKVLTDNKYYSEIANVIREQNGTNNTYTPPQMVSALKDLFYEEVEGVPPISFQGIGENLLDYRIDGASGGVGDRTNNLFNSNIEQGSRATNAGGGTYSSETRVRTSSYTHLTAGTYTIDCKGLNSVVIYRFNDKNEYIGPPTITGETAWEYTPRTFTISSDCNVHFVFSKDKGGYRTCTPNDIYDIQVVLGTVVPEQYEPYGYKVPVVISGKNIYNNELYPLTEGQFIYATNGTTSVNFNYSATLDYIPISEYAGQAIILNKRPGGSRPGIAYYDENYVYISGTRNNDKPAGTPMVSNVPSNAIYMRFTVPKNATEIQIELGENSSSYEPYHEPTTTNIYLDNLIRTVEDEVEYIDYSEQKQHRVRKNLLQNNATSQTVNGVTFTVNNDKSITCNGTATGTAAITINTIFSINSTKISGCPIGASWSSFELDLLNINTNNVDAMDTGNGAVIQNENSYRVRIRIASGYTCNNLTFYPMIRKADIEDDTYEPYIENTEVDVTLPAIPTIDGTNILTIDTTVQPSNVYVKSRHESSYEAAMRERYEEAQAQLDALESGGE